MDGSRGEGGGPLGNHKWLMVSLEIALVFISSHFYAAVSDLGRYLLPMSHKRDAWFISVETLPNFL